MIMKHLSVIFSALLLLIGSAIHTQDTLSFSARLTASELNASPAKLIPFPQEVDWEGEFVSVSNVSLKAGEEVTTGLKRELRRILSQEEVKVEEESIFDCQFITSNIFSEEAYQIVISPTGISLEAATETGHFYALQTLRQLFHQVEGNRQLPLCVIRDAPAFPVRGFMIDVGRNFQSIASLKKQLDIMAMYKLNVFQWHLTDRPAWRIESKKYPQLNAAEHHRPTRNPGQFYTYDEIRELIRYARERHIKVIPEIDMPGHSDSFTKAMGVKMESERGMEILEDVLAEFFAEIPKSDCPIIHIGSDEVDVPNPVDFMNRMVAFCESNDREVMIWNPGLPAKSSVIRQTWRPTHVGKGSFREVDSWNSYINNGEPLTQVQRLFFRPIGYSSGNEVIGGTLCLWPDVKLAQEQDAFAQNPVYPSLLTYAWRTWTADLTEAPPTYYMTLPARNTPAFDYFAAFEEFLMHHKEHFFEDEPFPYVAQVDKSWKMIGPFKGDQGEQLLTEEKHRYAYRGDTLRWQEVNGSTLVIKDRFKLGGHFPNAEKGEAYFAQTYIHADRARKAPSWIGFETPMRANRTYTGIPKTGQWDASGGNIWINDTPLPSPIWESPGWKPSKSTGWGSPKDQETPWGEEELYWTRTPIIVPLKKGWNKVLVKIPGTTDYQNWMFTFAPLNMDGLTFSTSPTLHSTYYYQRKAHFERLPNSKGEIIFIGDSIIDGCEWGELFGNTQIKNRGISGDVTQGVLNRLTEVTESKPEKVFLMIGTNDLARSITTEKVIRNLAHIVENINAESPDTEVFLHSILPVNNHYGKFNGHTKNGAKIKAVNAALSQGVGGRYTFIDLHTRFSDKDGKLDLGLSNDGLHLNGAGYERWAELIENYLK